MIPITIAIIVNNQEIFNKFAGACLKQLPKNQYELLLEYVNEKPAHTYNKMIKKASNKYILFIHSDIVFGKNLLSDLNNSILAKPNFGAMGLFGAKFVGKMKKMFRADIQQTEVDTVDSCCILINKDHNITFDKVNFNDFHFYVEDYCCQVRKKGLSVYTFLLENRHTMAHRSSTMTVKGSRWGRCTEYKEILNKKWGCTIPTTA